MKRLALTVLVAACASVPQSTASTLPAFAADAAEYAPFLAQGTGSVTGQGFLMTRGGDAKRAAGRDVYLDPMTRYAREWMRLRGRSSFTTEPPTDSLFLRARQRTVADADGRFTFANLAPGWYYVRTLVLWQAAGAPGYQGGVVWDSVHVNAGAASTVVVTAK